MEKGGVGGERVERIGVEEETNRTNRKRGAEERDGRLRRRESRRENGGRG